MILKDKIRKHKKIVRLYRKISLSIADLFWKPYILYYRKGKGQKKNPVFCECCIYFIGYHFRKVNWGDDINKYLFEYITGRKFVFIPFRKLSSKQRISHYSLIGSIIGFYNLNDTTIYGSGIKNPCESILGCPEKIISVRGPKTRDILLKKGIECPEYYGDPALLLPLFYQPKVKKNSKITIIPNMGTDISIVKEWISRNGISKDVVIINMTKYSDWKLIINRIISCDVVISESLHGLIVAETYGIANVWVEFVEHPEHWNFKYEDYFESIGKKEKIKQLQNGVDISELLDLARRWKKADIDYRKLLSYFPFELKENAIVNHQLIEGIKEEK